MAATLAWIVGSARRFLTAEGSARGLALMRVAVVLMLWSRLADGFTLHRDSSPPGVLLSAAFFGASLLMLVGWHSRAATVVTALCVNVVYHYLGPVQHTVSWVSHNIQLLVWTTLSCKSSSKATRWSTACMP